jgi:hypothetical protein
VKIKSNIQDKNPFRSPEGYFEAFTRTLMNKIEEPQVKEKVRFLSVIRPHLMIAAAILGFVVISYTALKYLIPEQSDFDMNIETADLTDYLSYQADEASILEYIDIEYEEFWEFDLEDEEIIDYLIKEDIDYLSIYENL